MMPSLAGQLVSLIKDTSLLSVISVGEFTLNAQDGEQHHLQLARVLHPAGGGLPDPDDPHHQLTRYLEKRNRFET